jgi:hypothetical protein
MKYNVIGKLSLSGLAQRINELLGAGWLLHGGPLYAAGNFCQAVVKYDPTEPIITVTATAGEVGPQIKLMEKNGYILLSQGETGDTEEIAGDNYPVYFLVFRKVKND